MKTKKMSKKGCWIDRPEKGHGRNYFLDGFLVPLNIYFTFPGIDCEDIKLAIKKGVINKNTFIIAIEEVKKITKKIRKYLDTLPNKYYIHDRQLRYFSNLKEVLDGREIDGAFLDFCGLVDAHSTYWFMKNKEYFADNCIIGYTVMSNHRRTDFIDSFQEYCFKGWGKTVTRKYCEKAIENVEYVDRCFAQYNPLKENRMEIKGNRDKNVYLSSYVVSLMFGVFCKIESIFSYKDKTARTGMNIIISKLDRNRKYDNICFENLCSFIESFYPQAMIKRRNKREIVPQLTEEEKLNMLLEALEINGIENNGVISIIPAKKAWITTRCNNLNRSVKQELGIIKRKVTMKTGVKATIKILSYKTS